MTAREDVHDSTLEAALDTVCHSSSLEVDQRPRLDTASGLIVGHDPTDEKILGCSNDKIVHYHDDGKQAYTVYPSSSAPVLSSTADRRIFYLKRKTFFIILLIAFIVVVATAVGGGVAGAEAARGGGTNLTALNHESAPTTTIPASSTSVTSGSLYANTGMSALRWNIRNGTTRKRLYYQNQNHQIVESAWNDNNGLASAWEVSRVSDTVKPGTPIGAVAGYPHASYNFPLSKNVYYLSSKGVLIERYASSRKRQSWQDSHLSGRYGASNSTFLTAYWNQDKSDSSQELVVLFQKKDLENSITQARFTSNNVTENDWVADVLGFSHPRGSTFAMALASYGSGKHIMLYNVDVDKTLQQHDYTINDASVTSGSAVSTKTESDTGLLVEPRSPLAVIAQDNLPLFTKDMRPPCTKKTPLTNLILYASPNRTSLLLTAWNCTAGFTDQTSDIQPLQKPNTTFLALSALNDKKTGDGNVYVMFDSGNGPQIEEWDMPTYAGDPWETSRNVTVDFAL